MDINDDSGRADFDAAADSAPLLTIAQARTEWDVQKTFLDSCSYGPPPRRGWDAMQRSLDQWRAGSLPWQPWAESVDASRELFGRLVGVPADQVATGAAVSQLLAPIAAALPDGAEVLIPDIEFTSGVYPFAVHADRGVRVRTAPLDTLAEAVDEFTTLVSFSAAQSATGEVADIPAITRRAREVGALIVLDGTQAAGWLPLNVAEVDFLAVAAYKWLCAPRGTAFLTMPSQATASDNDHPDRAWSGALDRLDEAGVRYSQAGGNMRFGFHLYNDEADVDTALNVVTS